MPDLATFTGRAAVPPPVDPTTGTVEIAGYKIRLIPIQFETFLLLRPGTPVSGCDLALLFHLPALERGKWTARQPIYALEATLARETGRDDLIERTPFGYRLVLD